MARWEDTFDKQLDLWKYWSSPDSDPFVESFLADRESKGYEQRDAGRALLRATGDALLGADPVWVDPDMMTLIEHAAKGFQPEPLVPQDLFTSRGFVWLPRPLYMTDYRGKETSIRAVLWTPAQMQSTLKNDTGETGEFLRPGVVLYMFSDMTDRDEWADSYGLTMEQRRTLNNRSGGAVLLHTTFMPFDMPFPDAGKPGGLWDVARVVQCLWRIASQTIAIRAQNRPPKPFRKRLERAKFPVREVTVITLRRPKSAPSGDHRDVEWKSRWIVSGHWRNQWYPSLNLSRQIWVSPYIKGPADKELVVRTVRAFEVVR